MQPKFQRRSPKARARHGKRLPQTQVNRAQDVPNITGPVTITVTQVVNPPPSSTTSFLSVTSTSTTTVFVSLTPSTSSSSTSTASVAPETSSVASGPTPSASAQNYGKMDMKDDMSSPSGGLASRKVPTGSIIGIVVSVALVFIAVVVFLLRRRFIKNRRNKVKLRGMWANKGVGSSFLWVEPKEKNITAPVPNSMVHNGFPYAGAQSAPPPPPLAHGTQPSNDFTPSMPMAAPLMAEAKSTPGQVSSAFNTTRIMPGSGIATVKSTFIPTLPDELSITTGETMRVISEYDDGWAFCSNARGERGMVPLECLNRGADSTNQSDGGEYRKRARVSSLASGSNPYGGISGA